MEFRKMRRARQALTEAESLDILDRGSSGVLALLGDGGWPYAVPLSYVREGGTLYFHCARAGHKYEAAKACPRASFCVVAQDLVVPETYSTDYRSAIAFGTLRELEDGEEKRRAIELLALKYAPDDSPEHRAAAIEREWAALCILALDMAHLSGKQSAALASGRGGN